ncbi:hypothetical protein O181_064882 [Austropuccinia psidii MF-1]|uniref:Uncharacterized protein n=1 Tax=Austropuccinia psidii MF-1 TaxID=1389203 RepID=A0A9Q3EWI5_9BASI|nr:hypothetical protein [Austropuccinia psidii MF-1]
MLLQIYSKVTLFPELPELSNQLSLPFPLLFHCQAFLDSNSKTIPHPRNSPIVTSQQLQPVTSSSRRREELSPLPFTADQGFQKRERWPNQVTREDPNMASDNQYAVAGLLRRADISSGELIEYANDRIIPETASEEMADKFGWYEDEPLNDFQKNFDHFGKES